MQPETYLNQLLSGIPLGDGNTPKLNENGIAYIQASQDYNIALTVNDKTRRIGLVAFLMAAPESSEGFLMHSLMSMGLPLFAEHQATLSIEPSTGMLILARTLDLDSTNSEALSAFIAQSSAIGDAVRATVDEVRRKQPAASAPSGTSAAEVDEIQQDTWIKL